MPQNLSCKSKEELKKEWEKVRKMFENAGRKCENCFPTKHFGDFQKWNKHRHTQHGSNRVIFMKCDFCGCNQRIHRPHDCPSAPGGVVPSLKMISTARPRKRLRLSRSSKHRNPLSRPVNPQELRERSPEGGGEEAVNAKNTNSPLPSHKSGSRSNHKQFLSEPVASEIAMQSCSTTYGSDEPMDPENDERDVHLEEQEKEQDFVDGSEDTFLLTPIATSELNPIHPQHFSTESDWRQLDFYYESEDWDTLSSSDSNDIKPPLELEEEDVETMALDGDCSEEDHPTSRKIITVKNTGSQTIGNLGSYQSALSMMPDKEKIQNHIRTLETSLSKARSELASVTREAKKCITDLRLKVKKYKYELETSTNTWKSEKQMLESQIKALSEQHSIYQKDNL